MRENVNTSSTKAGPGRRHKDGHKKATKPKAMGATHAQRINPEKHQRRLMIAACGGIRQFKKIRPENRMLPRG